MEIVIAQDNYPLMAPYDIENNKIVVGKTVAFSIILLVASVALIAVAIGLFVHSKKLRK